MACEFCVRNDEIGVQTCSKDFVFLMLHKNYGEVKD